MTRMWLPDRVSVPFLDNWPPKPLSIYADLDYERTPTMTDEKTTTTETDKTTTVEPAPPPPDTTKVETETTTTTTEEKP